MKPCFMLFCTCWFQFKQIKQMIMEKNRKEFMGTMMMQILKVSRCQWYLLSTARSHASHVGLMFFFVSFFLLEIDSMVNRQTHSCQFVNCCGFWQGLQTHTEVYQIIKSNYFSSCVCPSALLFDSGYHTQSTTVVKT